MFTAVWAENEFKQHRDDYEIALRKYEQAISPEEIARLRAQSEDAYSDMESAEQLRNVALYSAAGIVLISAVDAWLAHDRFYVGTELPEMAGRSPWAEPALTVGWRTRF